MNDQKYYTPTIEEFHVGFECEIFNANSEWFPIVFTKGHLYNDLKFTDKFEDSFDNAFRVKHLDREDIESIGFSLEDSRCGNRLGEGYSRYVYGESRNHPYIVIDNFPGTHKFRIFELLEEGGVSINLFNGIIKNKSELKRLMKQLGI